MIFDEKTLKIVDEIKRILKKGKGISRKEIMKTYKLNEYSARILIAIAKYEVFVENKVSKESKLIIRRLNEFEKLKSSPYRLTQHSNDDDGAYVLLLSDWHIGEVVSSDELGKINRYDTKIATRRVELLSEKLMSIAKPSSDLYIWLGGDMVSGNIHDELEKTNEYTITDQIICTAKLIKQFIDEIGEHFKSITIITSVGNHGRLKKEKQSKQRYDNYDYLAYKFLYSMLSDKKKIRWLISKEVFAFTNIAGFNFVFSHGDTIRMWNNIPYYGIIRDLQVKQSIKQFVDEENPKVDFYCIGHFHTPSSINVNGIYVIMNGSLKGVDEYTLSRGFLSVPCQKLIYVSKKSDVFTQYDIILNTTDEPKRYRTCEEYI